MRTFPLRIGTPDGLLFEGEVQRVVCRSITGDLAILAGHCNFCTALGMGEAHVILEDGTSREAQPASVECLPLWMEAAAFLRPPGNGRRTSTPTVPEKPKSVPRRSLHKADFPTGNTRS